MIALYLDSVYLSRSESTHRTYKNAMSKFCKVLEVRKIDPDEAPISELKEDSIAWLAGELKSYSPATEQCYLTAATGLFEFIAGEEIQEVNLPRVRLLKNSAHVVRVYVCRSSHAIRSSKLSIMRSNSANSRQKTNDTD